MHLFLTNFNLRCLQHVSNPKVHLQEDGCIYSVLYMHQYKLAFYYTLYHNCVGRIAQSI